MNRTGRDNKTLRRNAITVLGLLVIVLVAHEIFGAHGFLAMRRQRREYQSLQMQIQMLKRENEKLKQQIQALRTNPQAIQKIARERMHFARPGEIIYALPNRHPKQGMPAKTQAPKPDQP
jgi:cell division protein FtsB